MNVNIFIQQSLSPAIAISGIGLLILSLSNRIATIGSRIRQIRHDQIHYEQIQHEQMKAQANIPETEQQHNRRDNFARQINLFMLRARLIRNAMFLLYFAVSLIVLTEFCTALSQLPAWAWLANAAICSFLVSLLLVLAACVMEVLEVTANLETLKLEIDR